MTNQGTAIASRVKQAADSAGMSTNALAEKTGIPYKTLWRRLNFSPDHFKVDELVRIATATDTPWLDLIAGDDIETAA